MKIAANLYLSLPRAFSFAVFKGHWPNLFSEILTNGILEFSELFLVAETAIKVTMLGAARAFNGQPGI